MLTDMVIKPSGPDVLFSVDHVWIGYATFFPVASEYDLGGSPRSWALVPSLRHALTLHSHSTYFFALSPHALIMKPELPLNTHITNTKRLESLMLKDISVVPPDSVIKTFSHLKPEKVDLILTQDGEGLCQGSFILRQGDWAKFFLDTWFDPLYRSYNFQKAEGHALVGDVLGPNCIVHPHVNVYLGTCGPMASHNINEAGFDPTKVD